MVATDSYRLSVKETLLETAAETGVRGQRARSGASGAEPDRRETRRGRGRSRRAQDNQIVFGIERRDLSSRMIDGQFPNYRQLLPESYEHEVRLEQRRVPGRGPQGQPHGTAKRPAAASLRGRRRDDSAQTPDVGEASESAAGQLQRRGARDRVQSAVPAGRPRKRRGGRAAR